MKKNYLILVMLFAFFIQCYAAANPEVVVKNFGDALSSWCNTNNILYREKIDLLCSGIKSCRVEDKVHADFQKKRGLTNYETFVLDSYMNMFQSLIPKNVRFQMSNIKTRTTDIMKDGQLTFVTADIKISGPINYSVTDLFLVREGKITGIYNYSSQLGFSHLNGNLIRALEIGRYSYDIEGYFDSECAFKGGHAIIRNETGKVGLIDIHGNIIIPCIWAEIFYHGGAFATGIDGNGDTIRTYDLRLGGKVVPNINYYADGQTRNCFVGGFMKVASNNGLYGYLREDDFKYNVDFKYDGMSDFCNGYAIVFQNGKEYIIDSNFKILFASNEFYEISDNFYDGLAKVRNKKTNKYGFINLKGDLVIPCVYNNVGNFSEGLCLIYNDNNKAGFINKSGEIVIPTIYDYTSWLGMPDFKDGYISVNKKINGKTYGTLLGKNGKPLPGFTWKYNNVDRFSENKAQFEENGKWGFLDQNGQVVITAKYNYVQGFHNGYASVQIKTDGEYKWGCINHEGVEVIPCIYDNAITFENGIALVSLNGEIGLIDVYGNSTFK